MKRKLTLNETYAIIRAEEELGNPRLIYELFDNPNCDVYAEIEKRKIKFYEIKEKN